MSELDQSELSWWNVIEASTAVLFAACVSRFLGLKLEVSLILSGIRCVMQLTLMGMVLDDVLKTQHMSLVILVSVAMVFLGTYEAVFNRTKKTFTGMFATMFVILVISNLIITFIGTAFVLKTDPFWDPPTFVPVIGMLLGNSISSVAMATERCLDQFSTHAPMIEARLSHGATRYEAALPLAVEAIRMSILPVITQLSVMGMINIPGMMTGQIMAGTPMLQAVMYQQCIMFMVAASSTLGVIMSVITCLNVLIDHNQYIRVDRIIDTRSFHQHSVFKNIYRKFKAIKLYIGYRLRFKRVRKTISDEV